MKAEQVNPGTGFLPHGPVCTTETFERAPEWRHAMEHEIGYAMWSVEERTTGTFIGQCTDVEVTRLGECW